MTESKLFEGLREYQRRAEVLKAAVAELATAYFCNGADRVELERLKSVVVAALPVLCIEHSNGVSYITSAMGDKALPRFDGGPQPIVDIRAVPTYCLVSLHIEDKYGFTDTTHTPRFQSFLILDSKEPPSQFSMWVAMADHWSRPSSGIKEYIIPVAQVVPYDPAVLMKPNDTAHEYARLKIMAAHLGVTIEELEQLEQLEQSERQTA